MQSAHATSIRFAEIQPLNIGDPLPSISVAKVLNNGSSIINTGEYNDRLLILDFMATSCKSCIEAMPKFDSLQKHFGDRLQIVLVSFEKRERVKAFLEKNKIGKQIKFAFVTEDSVLKKFFPHEYISHVVWVNKGIVKAITRTQYLNASNIQTVLDEKAINWPIKKDITEYDYTQALFDLNEATIPEFSIPAQKYYTAFTAYLPGITRHSSEKIDSSAQAVRISMINFPIIDMYLKALGQRLRLPKSHMILEVKDKNRYVYNSVDEYRDIWRLDNNYSYEASFPISLSKEERNKRIKQDLDFYLGVKGRMEKRKVICLVVEKSGSNDLLKTIPGERADTQVGDKKIIETSISSLVYRLNQMWFNKPVIDKTNFGKRMFLEVQEKNLLNVENLRKELNRYGLTLREEEREIEMFVLTELKKE